MKIIIKTFRSGETFTLKVSSSDTALDVKNQIEKIVDLPVFRFRLYLNGRQLLDEKLSDYNVQNGTQFDLMLGRRF